MLKFYKKTNVKNIHISVDKYVPLTVNFSDSINSERLCCIKILKIELS